MRRLAGASAIGVPPVRDREDDDLGVARGVDDAVGTAVAGGALAPQRAREFLA